MDLHASEPIRRLPAQRDDSGDGERSASLPPDPDEPLDSLGATSLTIARLRRFIDGPAAR
jgi:hypothetical protein